MQFYFDNAATSYPKPACVIDAMICYQRDCGASPGRGAYTHAVDATNVLDRCRTKLCTLVNAPKTSHCIFTLNCTDALNLAILGITTHYQQLKQPVHIVTTAMDHNSVLRPLHALASDGVTHTIVRANADTGLIDLEALKASITNSTRLVAVAHGSNVTGTIQDLAAIKVVCGDTPLLVDAAQTMGHTPIDVQAMGIDLLAFPGHKGLLGPLGTGSLIMQHEMVDIVHPSRYGGTGSQSDLAVQPTTLPDKYESGSHNMLGIYGLEASVTWILEQGVESLHHHEMLLCQQFIDAIQNIPSVRICGPQTTSDRCAVFSLVFDGIHPEDAAKQLEETSGIQCRSGLHCAPFAHQTIGTYQSGGTVRVSFGPFTTPESVTTLTDAIAQCSQHAMV